MENQPLLSPQPRYRSSEISSGTSSDTLPQEEQQEIPKSDLEIKEIPNKNQNFLLSISKSIIKRTILFLFFYLTIGIAIYFFNRSHYSGIETNPIVDALYFCIVTMCTIGYGDIAPISPLTKLLAIVFVLFGFGFVDVLLNIVVNHVLDLQESMILTRMKSLSDLEYIVDVEKGRMKIRLKVRLALGVVVFCIGIGVLVLYFVEKLDFVDSVYLSVMSVTTVGYGDRAFKTVEGRLFAAIWLLVSTIAVARAFLYLAEARINRWQWKAVNLALNRDDFTVEDLLAADTHQHGIMSKSDFIVLKLKEMGKVNEKEVEQVASQFDKLDHNNLVKKN